MCSRILNCKYKIKINSDIIVLYSNHNHKPSAVDILILNSSQTALAKNQTFQVLMAKQSHRKY